MRNAFKGAALAIANTVAIAIVISLALSRHWTGLWFGPNNAAVIAIFGLFSAIPLGALIGVLAGRLRGERLLVLELVALALVPICGVVTMHELGLRPNGGDLCGLVALAASPTVL